MSEERRHFRTGPLMIQPALGIVLLVASLALAASRAWPVIAHFTDARALAANEPAARIAFAAVFVLAAAGIAIAMLERRNAAVDLDDDGLCVRSWWGARRRLAWDQIDAVILLRQAADEGDLPFHRLSVRVRSGRTVRLAGGPWPETPEVIGLRRKLLRKLKFAHEGVTPARWRLIFEARRATWM